MLHQTLNKPPPFFDNLTYYRKGGKVSRKHSSSKYVSQQHIPSGSVPAYYTFLMGNLNNTPLLYPQLTK